MDSCKSSVKFDDAKYTKISPNPNVGVEGLEPRVDARNYKRWFQLGWAPFTVILVLVLVVIFLGFNSILREETWEKLTKDEPHQLLNLKNWTQCQDSCRISVVESIPEGLIFNDSHLSTYNAWLNLINLATEEIDIGSYYWSLQEWDIHDPTTAQGQDIFNRLKEAGMTKKIRIRIAQNIDSAGFQNYDTKELVKSGAAEVRQLNFSKLIGSGIIHTKLWVADRKHVYIGSANLDWRSLTQVKELGILVTNCTCFAQDMQKIFEVYWKLGEPDSQIPKVWPKPYETAYGMENPMNLHFNGTPYETYISSSPPSFCPRGRTSDLDSILDVIDTATDFIHIAVMDYYPSTLYTPRPIYWPNIDDRLRSAAIDRNVKIKLLMSNWNDTRSSAFNFLRSLQDLNNVYPGVDIQIKLFEVPARPGPSIPYTRVNHNKYMVTNKAAYIGTSNWSGDYFMSTGGVGLIICPIRRGSSGIVGNEDVWQQLDSIFERDWNSSYAKPLHAFQNMFID